MLQNIYLSLQLYSLSDEVKYFSLPKQQSTSDGKGTTLPETSPMPLSEIVISECTCFRHFWFPHTPPPPPENTAGVVALV